MRYLFLFFLFLTGSLVFAQNAKIDSLKKVIATTKVDTVKGRSLWRLGNHLRIIGVYNEAIQRGKEGIKILEQCQDSVGLAPGLNNVGITYKYQGDFVSALGYFQKSLRLYEKMNDNNGIAKCLNNIGNCYQSQGSYPKALDYFQQSLRLEEKSGRKSGMAFSLNNIGSIYDLQGNYPKALEYFQKSLKIEEELGNQIDIADCLNNIGTIYQKYQGQTIKALECFNKSLSILEKVGDPNSIAGCLLNIGKIYDLQGNYPKALDYFQKSLTIFEEIGEKEGITLVLCNIGAFYLKDKKPQLAKDHAVKALKLAQEINYLEDLKSSAELFFKSDSALGDYKSAFEAHKLYKQYSDSLHNEDKAKEFGRVESKYQFEKEAEETKRKEAELAKIEAEETERRNNLQYLTIFAGIIGLFAGLVFMGKFKIPTRILDIAIFAGLLITFEFLLILFDPLFEEYSGGIPFYKLGFNTLIAFGFAPLHGFLEGKLKKRLVKTSKNE